MNLEDFKKKLEERKVPYEMVAGQFSFSCPRCKGRIMMLKSGAGGCMEKGCFPHLNFEQAIAVVEGKVVDPKVFSDAKKKADEPKLKITTWKEFESREFPANAWRVNGFIPLSGVTIIAAPSGEKKSWVVMGLARAIASGEPFLGSPDFSVQQAKVLYIENETPPGEVQRRGKMIGFGDDIFVSTEECPLLDNDEGVNELFKIVIAQGIGVVIIDTFRSVVGIKENEAETIRAFFKRFRKFADANVSIIFTDHCRKPGQMESKTIPKKEQLFGSQDKLAAVHALIMVKSEKKSDEIQVFPLKLKAGKECDPFRICMKEEEEKITFTYAGTVEEQKLKIEQTKEMILARLEEEGSGMDTKQLIEALAGHAGKSNVESALKEMRKEGTVLSEKVARKYVYRLPPKDSGAEPEEREDDAQEPLIPLDQIPDGSLGSSAPPVENPI